MICKYRIILSIDGAGIKGLVPLKILSYLQNSISKVDEDLDLTSWVDVFASVSASSIFTGALMLKDENGKTVHSPDEILDFYLRRGTQVFSKNVGLNPKESQYPLSFVLNYFFGKINTLNLRNHFLFLCYNQSSKNIFQFSNTMEKYQNFPLSKVMNACSAIENVYPSVSFENFELCDALNVFQNPSLRAYNYANLFYPHEHIVLISIGTGKEKNDTKASLQSDEVHQQILERKKNHAKFSYFRFQPELDESFDESHLTQDSIDSLLKITDNYLLQNKSKLDELLELLAFKAV